MQKFSKLANVGTPLVLHRRSLVSQILMKGHIFRYQQFRTMTQTNIPDIKKKKKKKREEEDQLSF